jgi:hypothetical protein
MKPPIKLLQERDFGQKINATFEFIGQDFKPLLTAMLYIAGPAAIVAGIFNGLYQSNILNKQLSVAPSTDFLANLSVAFSQAFTPVYLLLITFTVITSLLASLTVYAYVLKYEEQGSSTPTITPIDVWDTVKSNIMAYFGYTILLFVIIIVAAVLFVIPAIYISVVFSIIFVAMLRENINFQTAMSRCFYLIKDKWWSTFGLIVIMAIIQSIVGIVFQAPLFVVTILKTLKLYETNSEILITVSGIIGTLGQTLVSCLINLAVVFQYYNLVEKKDGVGILSAIDNIGKNEIVRGEE